MHLRRFLAAAALVAMLDVAHAEESMPRLVLVQPSAPEVPANLLRISIEFAAPIEGPVLPRIGLMHADGCAIEAPFLQQELWSPSGSILTILMHPGRVKTGLNAREQLGPILVAGDEVILTLDGRPIKHWTAGPVDTQGPVASAWKLSPVRPRSQEPLVVSLDGPIDGRDAGYLAIVDAENRVVSGHARLEDGERTWTFTPVASWRAGGYRLLAHGTLEDPAGNRLGSHFETLIDSPPSIATDETVLFTVGSSRVKNTVKPSSPETKATLSVQTTF
jgi:hypothetical protein